MRTGEGAWQKGVGLGEEGHGAGSQGCVAATATCPSVNTYPGTCSHAHTHTDALRALFAQKFMCMPRQAQRPTQPYKHTQIQRDTWTYKYQTPLRIHSGTCAATCPPHPPLLVPSLPRVEILQVAGSWRWAKIVTWHKTEPCLLCFPTGMKPQGSAAPLGQRSWGYAKEWGKIPVCPRTLG